MIGLTIRKTFYDIWDNLGLVFMVTVGFDLVLLFPVSLPAVVASAGAPVAFLVQSLGIAICAGWIGAFSVPAARIVAGNSPAIRREFRRIRRGFVSGCVYGLVGVLARVTVLTALQFYGAFGNVAGLIALSVVFWVTIAAVMMAGALFPIRDQQEAGVRETLRQTALLVLDNPLFFLAVTVVPLAGFVAIGVLLSPAAAFFALLVFPGVGGWTIWLHVAVLLRSRKYEWLREHPEVSTGGYFTRLPWGEILEKERRETGKRSIRTLFFPWRN